MTRSVERRIFETFNTAFLLLVAGATLYPFLHVLAASLSSTSAIQQGIVGVLPKGVNLIAYEKVVRYPMIWRAYLNTVMYTTLGTAMNLVMTTFGAFPLSRRRFVFRKPLNLLIVFSMLFSGGLIPSFLVVRGLGLYNTVAALILPVAVFSFYLIIMRTFFQQVPDSVEESALIDGCTEIQILFRIFLPLSVPALATIGLFYAVGHWNSFFTALLYLKDRQLYPIQILLREIVIQNQVNTLMDALLEGSEFVSESIKHATIMVATIPILLVYPFVQRFFVSGMMIGSIKG